MPGWAKCPKGKMSKRAKYSRMQRSMKCKPISKFSGRAKCPEKVKCLEWKSAINDKNMQKGKCSIGQSSQSTKYPKGKSTLKAKDPKYTERLTLKVPPRTKFPLD